MTPFIEIVAREAIKNYQQLYLMTINIPNEAMIGSHPEAHEKFISDFKFNAIATPLKLAMYSPPAWYEKENLENMFTLPITSSNVTLYSLGNYRKLTHNTEFLAGIILAKTPSMAKNMKIKTLRKKQLE